MASSAIAVVHVLRSDLLMTLTSQSAIAKCSPDNVHRGKLATAYYL
jgi:hypothetical protein